MRFILTRSLGFLVSIYVLFLTPDIIRSTNLYVGLLTAGLSGISAVLHPVNIYTRYYMASKLGFSKRYTLMLMDLNYYQIQRRLEMLELYEQNLAELSESERYEFISTFRGY